MNLKEAHPKYYKQWREVRKCYSYENVNFYIELLKFNFKFFLRDGTDHCVTLAQDSLSYATALTYGTIGDIQYQDMCELAGKICAARSRKYSTGGDPYYNFKTMAELLSVSVDDVFKFYMGIKYTRLLAQTGDHEDESVVDTLIDLANYALLYAGYCDDDDD